MVLLHEQEIVRFVETWRKAKDSGLVLRGHDDPNYESLETLLAHVFWWARYYAVWSCEHLGLADPRIGEAPTPSEVESELPNYLEHLLAQWRGLFTEVPEEPFLKPQFRVKWGSSLPVEHLLEHAVVHPMRHRLQLIELSVSAKGSPELQ